MVAWTLVFHLIGLVFWVGGLLVVTHLWQCTKEDSPGARAALGRLESNSFEGWRTPERRSW